MLEKFLVAAISAASLHASEPISRPFVPQLQELMSQLCVERLGDNGAMNGHQSAIGIYDPDDLSHPLQNFTLSGEQSACAFVLPGRYAIVVSSSRFEGPISDAPASPGKNVCHSLPYKVRLNSRERITLNVWPAITSTGYKDCSWDVLPRGTPQPGNCLQPHNPPECADMPKDEASRPNVSSHRKSTK